MGKFMSIVLLALFLVTGSIEYGYCFAPVPEIDPSLASSGIALLSCGVLILTSRRRGSHKE